MSSDFGAEVKAYYEAKETYTKLLHEAAKKPSPNIDPEAKETPSYEIDNLPWLQKEPLARSNMNGVELDYKAAADAIATMKEAKEKEAKEKGKGKGKGKGKK
ncbi:MAG: hypothetical protein MMC33_007197 [Icmadophila ericetorum]|nr:hypothetical protein [Icmadophila ericetorum]